jgi:hypothetical protein
MKYKQYQKPSNKYFLNKSNHNQSKQKQIKLNGQATLTLTPKEVNQIEDKISPE